MEQQDKRLICSFSNKNIFLAPARQYVFESDPLTHYWERCWVAIEFQEKSASTNELAGCQITSNFATYSAIRTHLIFPPMLWKSIRCKLVFLKLDKIDWHWLEASSLHQATSLKSEEKLCIGLLIFSLRRIRTSRYINDFCWWWKIFEEL